MRIPGWLRRAGRLVGWKPERSAGQWVRATYANDAGWRNYKLYLPHRGTGRKRPLVVMLHGCKQNPDDFAAGTRMNHLADEHGFLVAYPEQAFRANASKCWNWFRPAHQRRDAGEPSLIAGITREVIAQHHADPRRVYVAGLSAGGAMATILGCTYPDLYAAVGVHSGLPFGAASDASGAVDAMHGRRFSAPRCGEAPPTIVFHGDHDTTVHPRNGELVAGDARTRSVETGEASGLAYTRTRRAGGSEHWLVHGGGHAWSGGSRAGSFADPRGPDASREMLGFFLRS